MFLVSPTQWLHDFPTLKQKTQLGIATKMRYTSLELGHIITRLAYLRMTVEWMCF